ncbi:hypothetical protein N8Z47_03745 [Salibacteraceae bacterium]|nr:hypothetical protein [Salibacteraceae bacterium]
MSHRALIIILIITSYSVRAQEVFSGRLTFSIEYLKVPDDMKGVEAKLPTEVKIITDGRSWRSEQITEINGKYSRVYIDSKDSIFETITIGPERVRVSYRKISSVDVKSTNGLGPIVLGQETEICEISDDDGIKQSIIQLTSYSEIPNLFFNGLSGIPTVIEIDNAGIKMRLKLTSMSNEPLDETYFTLPDDYKVIDTALYQSWLR